MKISTFQHLQKIYQRFGSRIFGKLAQKLLAITFIDIGFEHVVERSVQGVDVDAARLEGERYALEVKTTAGQSIPLSEENIEALKDRAKDSYIPVIAALRVHMFENWVFARIPISDLRRGSIPISRLRAYRIKSLEALFCPVFEEVVSEHYSGVLIRGEHYLDRVLEQKRGTIPSKE